MKKRTLTQAMAWLHTWGGLLFGWPLFAIFLTGSLAVFDHEIDHWMQPEIQRQEVPIAQAAEHALASCSVITPMPGRGTSPCPANVTRACG